MGLCKKCVEVRLVGERQLSLTPNPWLCYSWLLFRLHADADVQSRSSPRLGSPRVPREGLVRDSRSHPFMPPGIIAQYIVGGGSPISKLGGHCQ